MGFLETISGLDDAAEPYVNQLRQYFGGEEEPPGPAPLATQPPSAPSSFGAALWDTVSTPERALPTAIRIGSGAIAGTGGPVGAVASGVGEATAQFAERRFGTRDSYAPAEMAAAALAGALPIGRLARGTGVLGHAAGGAAEGAAIGATTVAGRTISERGELPSAEEALTGAGIGAAFGGVLSGGARALGATRANMAPPDEVEASAGDSLARSFNPKDRTQGALEFSTQVIGPAEARQSLRMQQLASALDDAERSFASLPADKVRPFLIMHAEGGRSADPALARAQRAIQAAADKVYNLTSKAAPEGMGYLDNYIYPLFKDPDAAKAALARDPTFAMPKSFLQTRESSMKQIITAADRLGLELASDNIATLMKMRLGQELRFASLMDISKGAERRFGFMKVGPEDKLAPGEAYLPDEIASQLFPGMASKRPNKAGVLPFGDADALPGFEQVGAGERAVRLRVKGPEPMVRLMTQKLSPGLDHSSPLHWAAKVGGYIMSAKIAFSAFHPIFTGIQAAGSELARGMQRAGAGFADGDMRNAFGGLWEFTKGATTVPAALEQVRKGYLLMKLADESAIGSVPDPLKQVMQAGGRVKSEHAIANGIADTWRRVRESGGLAEFGGNTLDAISNTLSAPVMRGWVPWLKLGSLASSLEHEIAMATRANPNITQAEIAQIARGVSDVHDNFFGHMIPENLGFTKWMQDFLRSAVQFPGWNIGTLRTFAALGRGQKRAALGQKLDPVADMTSRYALGVLISAGLAGAAVYAVHNDGKLPTNFTDTFFPPTKSGERISIPSHIRTGVTFARHPVEDVAGKINPLFQIGWELANNLDRFAGEHIRTPGASFGQQAKEVASYVYGQVQPIPLSAHARIQESGEPTSISSGELFAGFSRAPKALSRSDAENLSAELNSESLPRGGREAAEVERSKLRRAAVHALRTKTPDAMERLQAAVKAGAIKPKQFAEVKREAARTSLQQSFGNLTAPQASRVWERATPEERRQLMPIYVRKLRSHPEEARRLGLLPR